MDLTLDQRIQRLEAYAQIRRLALDYAQGIDARDMDRVAGCYLEDYEDPDLLKGRRGRDAVKNRLTRIVRQFTTSVHFVGNHSIDLIDDDHATGVVYTRAEHEVGDKWIVMVLHYWDTYERQDGRWYFKLRTPKRVYSSELMERPTGPLKVVWPGLPPTEAPIPGDYPTWERFWAEQAEQ